MTTRFHVARVDDVVDRGGLIVSGWLDGRTVLARGAILVGPTGATATVMGVEFESPEDRRTGRITIVVERSATGPAAPDTVLVVRGAGGAPEPADPFTIVTVVGDETPARDSFTDPTRTRRMLRCLRGSARVVEDPLTLGPDMLDPAGTRAVPRGYRTDGELIWPEAVTYYLDRHAVAPPAALTEAIEARRYWPEPLTAERGGQARAALAAYVPGPFEPPVPPPGRFPTDVYDVLVTYGWRPERDIGAAVDAWLAEQSLTDPPAAGRAALAEFGGLSVPVYSDGVDWPVVGFETHPEMGKTDPELVSAAATRLGAALFPLGTIPDWGSEIVLDAGGAVWSVGPVEIQLGATIDEALIAIVRGAYPPGR